MKLVALLVLVIAAPVWAQSKRYPPSPVDKEREAEAQSRLWDAAINPARGPYDAALTRAKAKVMPGSTNEVLADAVKELDDAVKAMPNRPEAYRVRGEAHMLLREWVKCADNLQAAEAKSPRTETDNPRINERRSLGVCQAHAGRLAEAERTLADAAATGVKDPELAMRLGEVRIALGKLEEAKAALSSALESSDTRWQAMTHWLLALAYDQSRQPSEAEQQIREAAGVNRTFQLLTSMTFLGPGDSEYVLGLAYGVDLQGVAHHPEYQLVYFRRFLKLAPTSPWRRRAEEHLKELKTIDLPEVIDRRNSTTSFDQDVARRAVRAATPAMRACLAKAPNLILEVQTTKVGPRSADARDRPRYQPPPAVTNVRPSLTADAMPRMEVDTAANCVQQIAEKIPLPAVRDQDAYYTAVYLVVAP